MDHREIIVRMPESSAGIFSFVCSTPVHSPARQPASSASSEARYGFPPPKITLQATAAPSGSASAPEETGNAGDEPERMYPLCDELTELSLFCVYMPDFMSDGLVDTIEEFAFVDYLENLTNVHINFDVVGSVMTYMEQVSFMVAGGDMLEIFQLTYDHAVSVIA